jgi:hypothetical protein
MKPFRYTIASLWVAAAVVALDILWLRYMLTAHRSVFGFIAEGADLSIFLMANVLPFGLYPMLHRGGERRRFLVGFEVGGLAAALTFAACVRLAPDAVTRLASVILDPVWNLLFGWVRNGTIQGLLIYMAFLTAGFGAPQLLIAIACGIRAQRLFRRRGAAAVADRGAVDAATTGIADSDRPACAKSIVPSRGLIGVI